MPPTASLKAPLTIRSTHRVSQLLTGRGTISVPTALAHAVSTSKAPATAATNRPANGTTTMNSPGSQLTLRPTERQHRGHSQPRMAPQIYRGTPGNVALHAMEQAAGARYQQVGSYAAWLPAPVRPTPLPRSSPRRPKRPPRPSG